MGGCSKIFEENTCNLQSDGYCIKVVDSSNKCGNIVYSDNVYWAALALTIIPITKKTPLYKFSFISHQINFPLILAFTFMPSLFIIFCLILYFRPRPNNTVPHIK